MDVLQPSGLPRASWRTFCGSGRTHAEPGPRSRSLVAQLAGPPGRRAKVVFGGHRADQWRGAFDLQNITQMTVQGSNLTQRESFLLPQEFFLPRFKHGFASSCGFGRAFRSPHQSHLRAPEARGVGTPSTAGAEAHAGAQRGSTMSSHVQPCLAMCDWLGGSSKM